MKPIKYTPSDTNKIDLGTKIIYKYPTSIKELDFSRMVITGRNPVTGFLLEHDCQFFIYVTKGQGKVITNDEVIEVTVGDVVFVPKETKFAMEGDFEYVTAGTPAFYPEQAEEVES